MLRVLTLVETSLLMLHCPLLKDALHYIIHLVLSVGKGFLTTFSRLSVRLVSSSLVHIGR